MSTLKGPLFVAASLQDVRHRQSSICRRFGILRGRGKKDCRAAAEAELTKLNDHKRFERCGWKKSWESVGTAIGRTCGKKVAVRSPPRKPQSDWAERWNQLRQGLDKKGTRRACSCGPGVLRLPVPGCSGFFWSPLRQPADLQFNEGPRKSWSTTDEQRLDNTRISDISRIYF